MIVTWLCVMNVYSPFWNVDIFQMSLDLCRCCLDDYVVSIMFFDLCLVNGVVGL